MKVREADLRADRQVLIDLLRENLPQHGGAAHFDWLYLQNPAGEAKAWLAEDPASGDAIGVAAAFPRRMYVRGELVSCWNLGDFAIRKRHRSLGPAVALQRACLREVTEGRVAFAYDHPASNMMAIYRRLGIEATGNVVRFAKPLRLDDRIKAPAVVKPVANGVAAIGTLLLRTLDMGRARAASASRVSTGERVDERFDELDRRTCREARVRGSRDADYLKWRYLKSPNQRFEVLTVTQDETLTGYVVFYQSGNNGVIADLLADGRQGVDALVAGAVELARQRDLRTLSIPLLEGSSLARRVGEWGFRAREKAVFVVTTAKPGRWDGVVTRAGDWHVTDGDRDV